MEDSVNVVDDEYQTRIHFKPPLGHIHKGLANSRIQTEIMILVVPLDVSCIWYGYGLIWSVCINYN